MNYDIVIDQQIGWGTASARYVKQQLADLNGQPVSVYISSLGGSVNDALQIHQAFRDHGDVTCYLVGFVASAATLLSLGAKKVIMSRSALYLAHKCSLWVDEWGQMNEDEIADAISRLSKNAEDLVTIDKVVSSLYANRAGVGVDGMLSVMKDARWLACDEVLSLGLIDEIADIAEDGGEASAAQAVANIAALGLPALPTAESQESRVKSQLSIGNVQEAIDEESSEDEDAEAEDNEKLVVNVSPGLVQMVKDFFATVFGSKKDEETKSQKDNSNDNSDNNETTITMEEEKKTNQEEQQAAEETAAAERIEALERQNAELLAQIEALKAADGDETTENAGEADADDSADELTNVRAAYERLKGIL